MDSKLAKFAINKNLDELQDIFDIEDSMDSLMSEFTNMDDPLPLGVWDQMYHMRELLDRMRMRSMMSATAIHREVPDSHAADAT